MTLRHRESGTGRSLPLIVEPRSPALGARRLSGFIGAHADEIEQNLLRHGALLFRGFDVGSAQDFSEAADSLGGVSMEYLGGVVPRGRIADRIFNTTELTGLVKIRLHNELAYQRNYPDRLLFYCHQPSRSGGETFIADGRKIYRELPAAVVDAFESRQVRYVRNFRDAGSPRRKSKWHEALSAKLSWQDALAAKTPEEAEACCRKLGMEVRWRDNGDLEVCNVLPASKRHPVSGEICWFNQIFALNASRHTYGALAHAMLRVIYRDASKLPINSYFGDGEPIPDAMIRQIQQVGDANTVALPWRKGDVLMLDNHLVAHGRNPFRGNRKIMVSLLQMPKLYKPA